MKKIFNYNNLINWSSPLNNGLFNWWMAVPNSIGGSKLYDLTKRNHCTLINGLGWNGQNPIGGFLSFNGSNNYIESSSYSFNGPNELMVTARIYTTTFATEQEIISRWWYTDTNRSWTFRITTDAKIRAFVDRDGDGTFVTTRTGATALTANRWYDVAFVWKASTTFDVYVNGILDNDTLTGSISSTFFNNTKPTRIGNFPDNSQWFSGYISDVRIHTKSGAVDRLFDASRRGYINELNRLSTIKYFLPAGGGSSFSSTTRMIFDPWIIKAEV